MTEKGVPGKKSARRKGVAKKDADRPSRAGGCEDPWNLQKKDEKVEGDSGDARAPENFGKGVVLTSPLPEGGKREKEKEGP